MRKPSKGDLLGHYATREPQKFVQFDSWYYPEDQRDGYDCMMGPPDEEGVVGSSGSVYELMDGADVRVLIKPEVSIDKAAMMLRKIAEWVERRIQEVPQTVGTPDSVNGSANVPDIPF